MLTIMLDIILAYAASIGVSYVIETARELDMTKLFADHGYKLNNERIKELSKYQENNGMLPMKKALLIPLFGNVIYAVYTSLKYTVTKPYIIDAYNTMGALDKFSKVEEEEYAKKKNTVNAFLTPIKAQIRLNSATKMVFKDDNRGESELLYEIKDGNINILQTTGPMAYDSEEEQKARIRNAYQQLGEEIDKYGGIEGYSKQILQEAKQNQSEQKSIETTPTEQEGLLPSTVTVPRDEIERLEEFKKELIDYSKPKNDSDSPKVNQKTTPKM